METIKKIVCGILKAIQWVICKIFKIIPCKCSHECKCKQENK